MPEVNTSMDLGLTPSEEMVMLEQKYDFLKLIGEGATGKVYLVNHSEGTHKIQMACKIIHTQHAPKEIVAKFLPRELDILQKLEHPNIVHIYCIFKGVHGDKFLIFMRVAELGDLLDYVLGNGEVPEMVMKCWTFQLVLALEYLHTLEIAHRDLKCENILITKNYNIKLADFGFSRFMVDKTGKRALSSTYCGSLPYSAPEILRAKPYDPKGSDMWALGVVVFVGLNKSMPFPDLPPKRLYKLQKKKSFKFRIKIMPHLTQDCIDFVNILLEPDCKKRPTIDDIILHSWFIEHGERLKRSENEERALEYAKRNKRTFWTQTISGDIVIEDIPVTALVTTPEAHKHFAVKKPHQSTLNALRQASYFGRRGSPRPEVSDKKELVQDPTPRAVQEEPLIHSEISRGKLVPTEPVPIVEE
ncbi:testis-specific serine/threonine-protein kinase 3 [Halyomorpha halys]|uniref:testis-specific serine/threonine-protein kinase 3 n=1 Tax=Halyomorpha halys TaxID=286706 RepID=UPI0006D51239|nr:testis-specific serine/threonine-protein kinase 3-like [Halyomorpha halys]XP_014287741.1 testis-specific serine/threonine-protein kinase 3-like [Halyomorpha halys]